MSTLFSHHRIDVSVGDDDLDGAEDDLIDIVGDAVDEAIELGVAAIENALSEKLHGIVEDIRLTVAEVTR